MIPTPRTIAQSVILFMLVLIALLLQGCSIMDPDKAPHTVNLQDVSPSHTAGLPELNIEDVVTADAIKDILVNGGMDPRIIHPLQPKYTLITAAWIMAIQERLKATGQTGHLLQYEQKDLPSAIQQGAYQWYHREYPARLVRAGGQYRMLPVPGVAVGSVMFQGKTRNFFARRAWDNSVMLVFFDPVTCEMLQLTRSELQDCRIAVF